MRIETENRKMGEKSTGRNIPLLCEEGNDRNYETQHSLVSSGRLIWQFLDRF